MVVGALARTPLCEEGQATSGNHIKVLINSQSKHQSKESDPLGLKESGVAQNEE